MSPDTLPLEVAVPVAAALWGLYLLPSILRRIRVRKATR